MSVWLKQKLHIGTWKSNLEDTMQTYNVGDVENLRKAQEHP